MMTTYDGLQAGVGYDLLNRVAKINWYRDFYEFDKRAITIQKEPTSIWPTEVCAFGSNRLCVAGQDVKGRTVIRLWQFSSSENLEDSYIDQATGNRVFPDTFIPVDSDITLYKGNAPGKRLVRTMFKNYGSPDKLFVQFNDSRDLYQLDVVTLALTSVLSSTTDARLAHDYRDCDSWNHLNHGYLYCFAQGTTDAGLPECLILVDSDRNGQLDLSATMYLVGDEWKQTFQDQSLFQDVF